MKFADTYHNQEHYQPHNRLVARRRNAGFYAILSKGFHENIPSQYPK